MPINLELASKELNPFFKIHPTSSLVYNGETPIQFPLSLGSNPRNFKGNNKPLRTGIANPFKPLIPLKPFPNLFPPMLNN